MVKADKILVMCLVFNGAHVFFGSHDVVGDGGQDCDNSSYGCDMVGCDSAYGTSSCCEDLLNGDCWLSVDAAYRGEMFSNTRGGITTDGATRYTGRFDLMFTADLDHFGAMPGGVFVVHFQSLAGEGVTDRFVGAQQRISNIEGNPSAGHSVTQVSQYFWQRGFADGWMTLKIGKILADTEFAITTLGGDFINTSFGWTHSLPLAAYPDPTAGVVTNFQLTDTFGFKAGFFDGAPNGGNWGFSDSGDVQSIFEFRRTHAHRNGQLAGDIHVGLWYHNGNFADQAGGPNVNGNHGVYAGISQQLTRECPRNCDDAQGLGGFVQFGWAPEDRNRVEQYWGGGLVYRGLLNGRDADTCGFGIGNMTFSGDLPASLSDETMLELFYKARMGDRFAVQPDLQYFDSPGGQFSYSIVVGLRFEATL
jgi:porin